MVAGIKTSQGIKLQHTVGLQTLTMLMNAPCSLIMSRAERSFLLAIFLMKYCWKWVLVRGVPLQRTAKIGKKIKFLDKKKKKNEGTTIISSCDLYLLKVLAGASPAG